MADNTNILVRNTGVHPAIGFSFMLRVEGIYDLPCRAVRGFQKENEFEYIQEGGMNDYVHMLRKPISKPFTFKVERYVGVDFIDPLPLGSEPILPIILFVNSCAFPDLKPVRTYTFTGCKVISKDYGDLDAEKSGLVVETTTIAYREMICVAIPTQTYEETSNNKWSLDESNVKKTKNAKVIEGELDKSAMTDKADKNKWSLDESNVKKTKNAKVVENEISKKDMETEADKNKWQLDKSDIKKTKNAVVTTPEISKKDMETEADKNKWQLDKSDIKKTKNAKVTESELDKSAMTDNADKNKWSLDESNVKKTKNAVVTTPEISKKDMETKAEANKWPPKRNAKNIADFLSGENTDANN